MKTAEKRGTQEEFRKRMLDAAEKSGTRLILAIDGEDWEGAERVLNVARGQLAAVKVHPEHAPIWGMTHKNAVKKLREVSGGAIVILDAKLADIDKSNAMKTEYYLSQGYDAIICHGFEGKPAVKAVVDTANEMGKGVFLLVAMSSEGHLFDDNAVAKLTEMARELGVAGVVSPANQYCLTQSVKRRAKDLIVISPGIGAQGGDAEKAAFAGTDFVIVGRGVMAAHDVTEACRQLISQVGDGLAKRAAEGEAKMTLDGRLISALVSKGVLRFGDFTLKSGRKSTYFFNSGNLDSGEALACVGNAFADAIMQNGLADKFDVIFGPAYKGIPLGAAAVEALYSKYGIEKRFVFDRKEAKMHGDTKDKLIVGTLNPGDRVLLIDDVITTGDTKFEAMEKIKGSAAGAEIKMVLVLLNRQEKDMQGNDPVKEMEKIGVTVIPVLKARELMEYLHGRDVCGKTHVTDAMYAAFRTHVGEYGV